MVELISIHIGKTAGMSFREVLADVYKDRHMYWDYAPYKYTDPSKLPEKFKAVHGHIPIKKYLGHFPDAKRITWLRHPVFRLFSEYHFQRKYKDQHNALAVKLVQEELTFEQYIEDERARNRMSKQISGLELEDFFFVGIQEFYRQDLKHLENIMGWKKHEADRKNVNADNRYRSELIELYGNNKLIARIEQLNSRDFELYEKALEIRSARIGKSVLFQQTVSSCRRALELIE